MTSLILEATPARVRASTALPALVAVAVMLVAWWAGAPYVVGVFHDDGVYALLAKSIAEGRGFHHVGLPDRPAAVHYPPLYPLLLAAVWRIAPSFPDNLPVLLGLNALLAGVAALGMFRFVRARLGWSDGASALISFLTMISAPVLALASALLSETLFVAALWPALFVAERAADSGESRDAIAAGAAVGLLMLVRMHGVALLAALILVLLQRRHWRAAVTATAAAVAVVAPWQLWTALASSTLAPALRGSYGSYVEWFIRGLYDGGVPFVAATVRANVVECWLLLQDRAVLGSSLWLRALPAAVLFALCLVGSVAVARRAPVTVAFLVLYLVIVLVWPFAPWRFVWSAWPVVGLMAAAGGVVAWERSRPGAPRSIAALVLALPAVAIGRTETDALASRAWLAPAHDAGVQIAPVVAWVGRNTRPADVVLTEGEQVVSLFTGRRAAPNAPFTALEYVAPASDTQTRDNLRGLLQTVHAQYLVALTPSTRAAARSIAEERAGHLRARATVGAADVYQVVP